MPGGPQGKLPIGELPPGLCSSPGLWAQSAFGGGAGGGRLVVGG